MGLASNSAFPYRISGGSLDLKDPTYVERPADREFYEKLVAREYCYVLNSRQMGKSSLRVQTMHKLERAGIATTYIDLSGIGEKNTTPERWYRDLIEALARGFKLQLNRRAWWRDNNDLSLRGRFRKFMEEAILERIQQNIVIFIDEIDSVLRLSFPTDDFFTLIRSFYNRRATRPDYQRLTFTLLGVVNPYDLIQDKRLTAFNIGHKIALQGFTFEECTVFAQGFVGKAEHPDRVLKAVLNWTGGQPFLTQKLCWIVATFAPYIPAGGEERVVGQLARSRILEHWESQDDPTHLKPIRDRVLHDPGRKKIRLQLYRKILRRGEVPARDRPEEMALQLSGLIVKHNKKLKVYNRIYQSIFDERWVREQLDVLPATFPQHSPGLMMAASVVAGLLVMGLRGLGLLQPLEFAVFDKQMQLRPAEPPDERLLIVTITQKDIQQLGARYPIGDDLMLQLLKKLNEYNPSAIGIDIYRDIPVGKGRKGLIQYVRRNPHIFSICVYPIGERSGIKPLPGISNKQVGFINAVKDPSNTIRRHLLAAESPDYSVCPADYALSSQLAIHYLESKGYFLKFPSPSEDRWQFGTKRFEILKPYGGFYQNERDLAGHQILLNYRAGQSFDTIAQQVTLTEVMSDRVDPAAIENRIILLGVTDSTLAKDEFNTPYPRAVRGLILQAHMVSQLLGFVEDGRPLLRFLPLWGEVLFVAIGSIFGGQLAWKSRSLSWRIVFFIAPPILLNVISFIVLLNRGLLLPLIPSILALSATFIIALIFINIETKRLHRNKR